MRRNGRNQTRCGQARNRMWGTDNTSPRNDSPRNVFLSFLSAHFEEKGTMRKRPTRKTRSVDVNRSASVEGSDTAMGALAPDSKVVSLVHAITGYSRYSFHAWLSRVCNAQ